MGYLIHFKHGHCLLSKEDWCYVPWKYTGYDKKFKKKKKNPEDDTQKAFVAKSGFDIETPMTMHGGEGTLGAQRLGVEASSPPFSPCDLEIKYVNAPEHPVPANQGLQ